MFSPPRTIVVLFSNRIETKLAEESSSPTTMESLVDRKKGALNWEDSPRIVKRLGDDSYWNLEERGLISAMGGMVDSIVCPLESLVR